jgi:hypothetical protein
MPDDEKYYSNPRIEMAPEDYAPDYSVYEQFDYGDMSEDKEPSPYDGDYDDGGDDE